MPMRSLFTALWRVDDIFNFNITYENLAFSKVFVFLYVYVFIFKTKIIGYHCDKLAIGRLAT